MHLFSCPPVLAKKKTPASAETGVRIGMVAGAGFGRHLPFTPEVTFILPSLRGTREGDVVPAALAQMHYVQDIAAI